MVTKNSAKTTERLFTLDSSLSLTDGAHLDSFVLDVDRLDGVSVVTATETFQTLHIVTLSDSGTLTSTESYTATGNATFTDSGTVTATESMSIFTTSTLTDSDTITSTESAVLAGFFDLTDTATLTSTETRDTLAAFVGLDDLGSVRAAETFDAVTSGSNEYSESGYITALEDISIFTEIVTTSINLLSATEFANIQGFVTLEENAPISTVETAVLYGVSIFGQDLATLSSTEQVSLETGMLLSDRGTITSSSVAHLFGNVNLAEQVIIGSIDTLSLYARLFISISELMSATEASSVFTQIAYVPTQELGGITRYAMAEYPVAITREIPVWPETIRPVSTPTGLSATITQGNDNLSLTRSVSPQPRAERSDGPTGASIARTSPTNDLAVQRTAPEAELAITRTFKGEL